MTFSHAKPIWLATPARPDEFAEFRIPLTLPADAAAPRLVISADSDYNLLLGDRLLAFGQYADYPEEKVYDEVSLEDLPAGEPLELRLIVWYYGINTQTYIKAEAGVIFEITAMQGDVPVLLAASGEQTESRLCPAYRSHTEHLISPQLGPNYHVDSEAASHDGLYPFAPSRLLTAFPTEFFPRPIHKLELLPNVSGTLVQAGAFTYGARTGFAARDMQAAALCHRPLKDLRLPTRTFGSQPITLSEENGQVYFIVDLGREEVGFLCFDLEVDAVCDIEIGYGEHLDDGRCRTAVRNFAVTYRAHAGRNRFLGSFRRFGCRYLQLFVHADRVTVHDVGIRPTVYPLTPKVYRSGNLLRDTVYEVCQHTLRCCMHEHYEDCPWREQALYTMDSRNQMLCGYYAFGETRFARACLHLMGHGMRPDGILTLCYPAGKDFPIPAFSTVYFIQMWEYMEHSGDLTLAQEYEGLLCRLMETFLGKMRPELGLIENFYGNGEYWNFYEWSETMSGRLGKHATCAIEAPLNAFLSLALQALVKILRAIGKGEAADRYEAYIAPLNAAIRAFFFREKDGLFASFDDRDEGKYSVLTNALCLLCGAAEGVDKTALLRILAANGAADTGLYVIPNTLSMNSFRFDALLREDRARYAPIILAELDRDYLYMLRHGATTFWETIEGAKDFSDAGSLCHGWSALPIYYYETLL
ncbi:MAG: hypothetical protein IJW99_11825 [Clostridia bacterium]|nr:hypothetical protein [Clostridia bacterium]